MDSLNMEDAYLHQGNMDDHGSNYTAELLASYSELFHQYGETPLHYDTNQIEDWQSQSQSQSQQTTVDDGEANNEAGPSDDLNQTSKRGRRAKLSEDERKANKRDSDRKHRQKKKQTVENLEKENEKLNSVVRSMEKRLEEALMKAKNVSSENEDLKTENKQLQFLADQLKTALQGQREEVNKIKDCQDINSNNQESMCTDRQLWEGRELLTLLGPDVISDGVAICESITKCPGSSGTIICNVNAPAIDFIGKLDADEMSNVDFQDFTDLDGEHKQFGRYQIPLSLVPTAVRICEVYGDISATSKINPSIAGKMYILFCATIKEMGDLQLEQVTEGKMLKWRDAIKDALRIEFKVEFAMDHLKKIARGYFGVKAYKEVKSIDVKISKLEAHLIGLRECKAFMDIAKEFNGKPVSEGLWG